MSPKPFQTGGMVHHNLIVKGPLFPLFPEGYTGPQAGGAPAKRDAKDSGN